MGPLAVFGEMPRGGRSVLENDERDGLSAGGVWKNDRREGRYRIFEKSKRVGTDLGIVQKGQEGGKSKEGRGANGSIGEMGKRKGGKTSGLSSVPRKKRVVHDEDVRKKRAKLDRESAKVGHEKGENGNCKGEAWSGKHRARIGAQSPTSVFDMHCSPRPERLGCATLSEAVGAERALERQSVRRDSISKTVGLRRCVVQEESDGRLNATNKGVSKERDSEAGDGDVRNEWVWLESMPRAKNVACSDSRIHGTGLFAMERISAGEFVIEYGGARREKGSLEKLQAEYTRRGIQESYIFELPDGSVIDGTLSESLARYINHSCNPNMCAHDVWVEGEYRVMLYAVRDVGEREELTCDYRFELEDEEKKVACLCGARQCQKFLNYDPDGFRTRARER